MRLYSITPLRWGIGWRVTRLKHYLITIFLAVMGAHETIWLREQNGRLYKSLRQLEHSNDYLHSEYVKERDDWRSRVNTINQSIELKKAERNFFRDLLIKVHPCQRAADHTAICEVCDVTQTKHPFGPKSKGLA